MQRGWQLPRLAQEGCSMLVESREEGGEMVGCRRSRPGCPGIAGRVEGALGTRQAVSCTVTHAFVSLAEPLWGLLQMSL